MFASEPESTPIQDKKLPRGINSASKEFVRASQRSRLIEAMIEMAGTSGFPSVTIGALTRRAGIGKQAFYDHFTDKEDCFVAVYDDCMQAAMLSMTSAFRPDFDTDERIVGGLHGLLSFLAEDDNRARIIFIESLKAGERATDRLNEAHNAFAKAYISSREEVRQTHREYPSISQTRALAIIGAMNEPICAVLRTDHVSAVLRLEAELVDVLRELSGVSAR